MQSQEEHMKKSMLAGSLALAAALGGALAFAQPGLAERWERERWGHEGGEPRGLAPVKDPKVLKECGSCHMAFLPGFLPARSWEKIMSNLKDHFGDNATLDEATAKSITEYLTANASDAKGRARRGAAKDDAAEPIIRISELPWFKAEHGRRGRLSPESLKRHKAKSKSDCKACHPGAEKGFFDDD
jgi:hypothetical protein